MPTTVVNPAPSNNSNSDNGLGFLLGVIVLIFFAFVLIYYGFPMLKQGIGGSTPQINVPNKVDVNLRQSK